MFTFSSSGLWTGDPDPAPSKSTLPLMHTSLITLKAWRKDSLVHIKQEESPHSFPDNYQESSAVTQLCMSKTGQCWFLKAIITHGLMLSLKITICFLTPLPHNQAAHFHTLASMPGVIKPTCTLWSTPSCLTVYPIMLLNGSQWITRQCSPCSEITAGGRKHASMFGRGGWKHGGVCYKH